MTAQERLHHRNAIRDLFTRQGYEIRIDMWEHVHFRRAGGRWRQGRCVTDYVIIEGEAALT